MGDIAEMMLDGCLCFECGEYLHRDSGYPQLCPACAKKRRTGRKVATPPPHPNDKQALTAFSNKAEQKRKNKDAVTCPHCMKRLKSRNGRDRHVEMVHAKQEPPHA